MPALIASTNITLDNTSAINIPGTPVAGQTVLYPKADKLLYYKDDAGVERGVSIAGEIFTFGGTSAPAGSLVCPVSQTNISRSTYAALFTAIGTTWGAGDGSTTFGIPWFPADYTLSQANANVGTATTGALLAHTHPASMNYKSGVSGTTGADLFNTTVGNSIGPLGLTTGSTGGSANLAAGHRVLICVKF